MTMSSALNRMDDAARDSLNTLIAHIATPDIPDIGLTLTEEQSSKREMPTLLLHVDEADAIDIPLLSDTRARTNYSAFTRAIDSLKTCASLAVFSSTASRLYQLAPPKTLHGSERVMINDTIPLPYWELPFDINPEAITIGTLTLAEITTKEHLVKFGRPM